jgi:ABC-type transport system involved in cytochrome bd biosynthesis fused ATPase/permease subunit
MGWLVLGTLAVPIGLAAYTDNFRAAAACLALGLCAAAVFLLGEVSGSAAFILGCAVATAFVAVSALFPARKAPVEIAQLTARVDRLEKQLLDWLHALDARARSIDEQAVQAQRAFNAATNELDRKPDENSSV